MFFVCVDVCVSGYFKVLFRKHFFFFRLQMLLFLPIFSHPVSPPLADPSVLPLGLCSCCHSDKLQELQGFWLMHPHTHSRRENRVKSDCCGFFFFLEKLQSCEVAKIQKFGVCSEGNILVLRCGLIEDKKRCCGRHRGGGIRDLASGYIM